MHYDLLLIPNCCADPTPQQPEGSVEYLLSCRLQERHSPVPSAWRKRAFLVILLLHPFFCAATKPGKNTEMTHICLVSSTLGNFLPFFLYPWVLLFSAKQQNWYFTSRSANQEEELCQAQSIIKLQQIWHIWVDESSDVSYSYFSQQQQEERIVSTSPVSAHTTMSLL